MAFDDTSSQPHVDVRRRLNLTHEVVGHAGVERRAVHDQRDVARELRQMESRLARRVGTPHDAYPIACESGGFRPGGPLRGRSAGRRVLSRAGRIWQLQSAA